MTIDKEGIKWSLIIMVPILIGAISKFYNEYKIETMTPAERIIYDKEEMQKKIQKQNIQREQKEREAFIAQEKLIEERFMQEKRCQLEAYNNHIFNIVDYTNLCMIVNGWRLNGTKRKP
jgi:hypothetical protein